MNAPGPDRDGDVETPAPLRVWTGRPIVSWVFGLFWLITSGAAWIRGQLVEDDPWERWVSGLLFGLAVVFLGFTAWRAARARPHAETSMRTVPERVLCGTRFQVQVDVSAAAAAATPEMRVRLMQCLNDASGSGLEVREVWEASSLVRFASGGGPRCAAVASFELPPDGAASGHYRHMEQVEWTLELHLPGGRRVARAILQVLPNPALQPTGDAALLGPRLYVDTPLEVEAAGAGKAPLAKELRVVEDEHGWELHFPRSGSRFLAKAVLVAIVGIGVHMAYGLQQGQAGRHAWPPADLSWQLPWLMGLVPWLLHLASVRWVLRIDDDGLTIDRSSWLWRRRRSFPASAMSSLATRLVHKERDPKGQGDERHMVVIKDDAGADHWMTPQLDGLNRARAIVARLKHALQERGHRFAPGLVRGKARAGLPAVVPVLVWLAWAGLSATAWQMLMMQPAG
jgi:hypothetical protein